MIFYILIVALTIKIILDMYIFKYLRKKRIQKNMVKTKKEKEDIEPKPEKKIKEPLTRFEKTVTIINIVLVFILVISSVWSAFNLFAPKSNTSITSGGKELAFIIGSKDARWQIWIKNNGDGEAQGIDLEVEFPDGSTIQWKNKLFQEWNGNWSREPDYLYSKNNYCSMRWDYLSPHCEIRVDLQIQLPNEGSYEKIYPNHVVVSVKNEKSPIFEYP